MTTSKDCLELFNRNSNEFLWRFVAVDEIRIHYNTPEIRQQSKQWVSAGEPAPKKAKVSLSANKIMVTVFWDTRGIIHIDNLQKGKTINGGYYANLLDRFNEDLKKNEPIWPRKKFFFIKIMHGCTRA